MTFYPSPSHPPPPPIPIYSLPSTCDHENLDPPTLSHLKFFNSFYCIQKSLGPRHVLLGRLLLPRHQPRQPQHPHPPPHTRPAPRPRVPQRVDRIALALVPGRAAPGRRPAAAVPRVGAGVVDESDAGDFARGEAAAGRRGGEVVGGGSGGGACAGGLMVFFFFLFFFWCTDDLMGGKVSFSVMVMKLLVVIGDG